MRLPGAMPAPRPDRPASAVLHDEANVRIVGFHLLPGQRIPAHRSESTVVVQVVSGSGRFRGAASDALLSAGENAVFEPGEEHAIDTEGGALQFVAIITPRPGG